jgi:hypothetical protein
MDVPAMLAVLAEVRELLARPDADYTWSSFLDADSALAEVDAITDAVRTTGTTPAMLGVLFAPTGPLQEVAISSGWGDHFLTLANRFDAAY